MPPIFFFLRPHIRDSHLRLTFATHIRDPNFATHIHDPHSRPRFATPLATHVRDSSSDSSSDSH